MKNLVCFFLILHISAISCSKKRTADPQETFVETKYDTTAIDSFSNGAISVDVAEKIRMSSIKYRDSVKQVLLKQEEEKKLKAEEEKLKKAEKEAADKEKAKEKDLQKDKEKTTPSTATDANKTQ